MSSLQFINDLHNYAPEKVSILGAAKSGIAAARYFINRKSKVFISDSCSKQVLEKKLSDAGLAEIESEADGHSENVLDCDLIIVSPGVRSDHPLLTEARRRKIVVWSELELGYRASYATFVAVTGSTGKSTTVSLLGKAMSCGGKNAVVAGNIGLPVITISPSLKPGDHIVAEVSSFQLEIIDRFRPKVSAILNLMKNHLDRYSCEDDYYAAKKNIIKNQNNSDYLVLNANDPKLLEWSKEIQGSVRIVWFGKKFGDDCFFIEGEYLKYSFDGKSGVLLNYKDMKLKGEHNYQNACAAAAISFIAGASDEGIREGICSFEGLAHRLEFVGEINSVSYYNDSKATTAESICCAVSAFQKKVHLIAGGKDKGCDFDSAKECIARHVKSVTLIGEASGRIKSAWGDLVPVTLAKSLNEAVDVATDHASAGEVVVFSPGCSSFDMFRNFEERGNLFKSCVKQKKRNYP
ncbi:UDP-N-acetylmuramoyl-L-alanine--D-glutamate ligase [Chitinispirillales bacterium ANBcel5]|uniref:UDP-N-acetylmuramoyl-L-alanine--D-glutamate ligase n=1 Tax=Cellulosispirillum alkaliphilum TaxID=3039283 RepID=UPI002A54F322|nr:UDP-N-acetylmuramoyl-L-alanine--D-glutamate ligase [Chitinispirillales bacterium ANBcel5]